MHSPGDRLNSQHHPPPFQASGIFLMASTFACICMATSLSIEREILPAVAVAMLTVV